jgi:hypothetical protein
VIFASGTIAEALYWLCQPGCIVMTAGFQNIEERPPEPEAAPAKDSPWARVLCSRTAKPPACAWSAKAAIAVSETVAAATARWRILMIKPALETQARFLFASRELGASCQRRFSAATAAAAWPAQR